MVTSTPQYGYPIIEPGDYIRTPTDQAKLASDINRVSIRSEAIAADLDEKAKSSVAGTQNALQAATAAQDKNLLQDIALEAQELRIKALEALASLDAGDVSDGTVAGLMTNEQSLTFEATESAFVKRGTLVHDVRDYGAKGDNVTDDSAAFQAAIEAARVTQGRAYAYGTFRLDQPILINANAEFNNATVNYHGHGVAITVQGWRLDVKTPSLFNALKAHGGGWDGVAGSVGVRLRNTNGCHIYVKFVQAFETGLSVFGDSGGAAYNIVELGWLFNNKINMHLHTRTEGSTGYSNQNTYIGGRLSHHAAEGTNIEGVYSLLIGGFGDGGPNSNIFINTCLEGAQAQYAFNIERGIFNKFVNVRLEYGNAYRFGPGARDNEVTVGFYAEELTAVREDLFGNTVEYARRHYEYDKIVQHWATGSNHFWFGWDHGTRRVYIGNGVEEPLTIRGGSSYLAFDALQIRPETADVSDLGAASVPWRHLHLSGRANVRDGVDYLEAPAQAPAASGRARTYAIRNQSGKMELRVRWPNGAQSTLATEP